MAESPVNPLIVQSDRTLLLDVHAKRAEDARAAIMPFAELEKSPEHIHTYRISPLSLWNAASAGFTPDDIAAVLREYTRYQVPAGIVEGFSDTMARYGKICLIAAPTEDGADAGQDGCKQALPDELLLVSDDNAILEEIAAVKSLEKYLTRTDAGFSLRFIDRGSVKRELIKIGWPVKDDAPFAAGEDLAIQLRETSAAGMPFAPRDYQMEAAKSVYGSGGPGTGYGVVVLPCGSGKTIVGMAFMALLKTNTLILTTNVAAVHQWIEALLDKTDITREQIAEYTGDSKSVAPVTKVALCIVGGLTLLGGGIALGSAIVLGKNSGI